MCGLEMSNVSLKIPPSGGINVEWQNQTADRAVWILTDEVLSQVLTSSTQGSSALSRPHPGLTFSRCTGSATQAAPQEEPVDYVALVAEIWQLQSNCIMNRFLMPALIAEKYMFLSRRLCKHIRAGVWVKQCTVYTISSCATWGQINNPGWLARGTTKCGGAQWRDSKQIQINPSWIETWDSFHLQKGSERKLGIMWGDGWSNWKRTLKPYCTWKLSVASGSRHFFTFFPPVSKKVVKAKTKPRWRSHQRAE